MDTTGINAVTPLAKLVKPLALKFKLANLPQHAHQILIAYLLYEFVFRFLSPLISSRLTPRYATFDYRTKTNWNIHMVSMVQCIIICTMAIHYIATDPTHLKSTEPHDWRDRLWGSNAKSGRIQAFANGYFIWDTLVSIEHFDSQGIAAVVHGITALLVSLIGFRPFANFYGVNIVLFELSTPFLNIHWFMDKLGMTGTTPQLINGIFFILSFFLCRLVWGSWQTYSLFKDVNNAWASTTSFSKVCNDFIKGSNLNTWVDTPWRCRALPTWLGIFYIGGLLSFTLLNMFWFTQIISAVQKRFVPTKKKLVEKKTN